MLPLDTPHIILFLSTICEVLARPWGFVANVVPFHLFQLVLGLAMSYGCETEAADGIERSISIAMRKNGFAGCSHLKPLFEKASSA
jgi:hypothetical protein